MVCRERFDEIAKKIKRETDVSSSSNNLPHQIMGRRQTTLQSPPGTLNTITPCAACKLLRRRCVQECPFSPYFSPHEPHKFASVHKVFGASNVSKMLMVTERLNHKFSLELYILSILSHLYLCLFSLYTLKRFYWVSKLSILLST